MAAIFVNDVVVGEGDGFVDIVVALTESSLQNISVNYSTSNSTALVSNGADATAVSGSLSFVAGETLKTVRILLTDDGTAERFEHFRFNLSAPVNATLADASAMVSIVDNDTSAVLPGLFVRDVVVDEKAGTASFVVLLGGPEGQASTNVITVDYATADDGAVAGSDYTASSGTLTFAPGETVKTVVVDITDDATAEGIERFALNLSEASNATIVDGQGIAGIAANDAAVVAVPRLSVADMVVGESDGYLDVVVSLSAPGTQVVTVNYTTYNSTAVISNSADATAVSGSLSFAVGETSKTVRMAITDDSTAERFEHFVFTLSGASNATLADASAMVSIVDNDTSAVLPGLFVRDVVVDEKAGTASFVVLLGGPEGQASTNVITVDYATADDGAVAGSDYTASSGTLTFAPGETVKTVVVDITDDATAEGIERFALNLSEASNATIVDGQGIAGIAANDAAVVAVPRLSVADMVVGESDGYLDVVVSLSAPGTQVVTVNYTTYNSTAVISNSADATAVSGSLSFAVGETSKTVRMAITDDSTAERFEHFVFTLSGASNATLADASAMVSIVDNDTSAVLPGLFVRDVVVDEKAGTASFVVLLGGPEGQASTNVITVDYATADDGAVAGSDYTASSGTLTFAPGETVKTVVVDITDDATAEGIERFALNLSEASNATIVDGQGIAGIAANDAAVVAVPRLSVADMVVGESDGYLDVVVSLSAPGTQVVTVNYTTYNSTAVISNSADATAVSGSLSFAVGETSKTVRMAITDDSTAERFEHFVFTLSGASNATLADASAMVSIVDDDTPVLVPGVYIRDAVVDEQAGTASFVVTLGTTKGEASIDIVTVDFATADGSATAGSDYTASSGTLTFAPGETTKTIVVDINDDGVTEGGERLNLVLSNPDNAVLIDPNAVAVIGSSDAATVAVPLLSVANFQVSEADGFMDVVVSLSAPGTQAVTVNYSTYNGTAVISNSADATAISGSLSFANGETTRTVRIAITDDNVQEGLESFTFTLGSPTNASLGNSTATISIVDDDTPGVEVFSYGISDDVYTIDATSDVVVENPGGGVDLVMSSITYTLGSELENLTLTGLLAINGTGNALDNVIVGNEAANRLQGLSGNDWLDGGEGADTLEGGTGDDTFVVDNAGDVVSELIDSGIDLVRSSRNYTLGDHVENLLLTGSANISGTGNSLANVITGNSGANTLDGGNGDDTLDGGAGADQLVGGRGSDVYLVTAGDVVVELELQGIDTVRSSVSWTLDANVEVLELIGNATASGTGNDGANTLVGNSAGNLLTGGKGYDTLDGGLGVDTLVGGLGYDSYVVTAGDVVVELANQGYDKIYSDISWSLEANIEKLFLTGSANVNGTGNELNNQLFGNSANNSLAGGAGDDTLTGGLGIDTLSGGLGNDTYFVDVGDVLLESPGAGVDVVKSAVDWTLGVEFENLRLIGTASVQATGNAVANTINGNVGDNLIAGAGGNDLLRGAAGNDTLDGGDGNDTVYGGAGDDSMLGGDGDDSIGGGNGTDEMLGGAGNDTLVGGDGFDFLGGGAGIDVLKGGRGGDTLTGNDGADVFVFDTALSANNIDTITDFVSGQDLLRLDDDVFTALSAGVALGAAQLLVATGATSAQDSDDRIIYNTSSGALYYDADGVGGTAAVQFAQLGAGTHPGLTAEDFLVVA